MGRDRVDVVAGRFEIWLVRLDPAEGREIRKTRPCVIVSPDEMNRHIGTVIVAPMTTTVRDYPTRVAVRFHGKAGEVVLDQLRAVDRRRLARRLGRLDPRGADEVLGVLGEMFAP